MTQTVRLFAVALAAGAITLGGYKLFVEDTPQIAVTQQEATPSFIPTTFNTETGSNEPINFTEAAEKTVHAVVHVKNTTMSKGPTSMRDFFFGGGSSRPLIGTGSGVIISPDGYIITNNHVIENSTELEVTLNNNKSFEAELIGTDPKTDIALIKIEPDGSLPFVPFADSNNVKIGEWVLAVGNPFNLTSTVTAGIVSAKARDLNEFDAQSQSFIQTDAAVNRGNSGGALVNTQGQLIGINTAITSETGSYVGYSFAVPSNTARKIVEDIMEYGNVQRGILGIQGGGLNSARAEYYGIDETEGVYVAAIEEGSGADKGGIQEGDVIKQIDGYKIAKFSDLTGYLGSKRPNDVVDVTVLRDGRQRTIPVTLIKLEVYEIEELGIEIKNASEKELRRRDLEEGVKINRIISEDMSRYDLDGAMIIKINDIKVSNIDDAKRIMRNRDYDDPIKMTFVDRDGKLNSFIFR
ncbi:trypsin-like peptidase domain-containing protein [Aureisphaera galaxeae]|uniref:S1C family serine protease n=1 Tax=Aureisphaera galaxeae TaxID=1538023 RepID=UPI00234FCD6E|nr:trypsin-like peptidase domain-containing protein [Aureisphaera galaxeae]MDC8004993.1 trypsin-like peptidase domain-containing protein [Aureisphaera galaxeae]